MDPEIKKPIDPDQSGGGIGQEPSAPPMDQSFHVPIVQSFPVPMPLPPIPTMGGGGGAIDKFIAGIKEQLKGQLLGEIETELLSDNFETAVDAVVKAICSAINRDDNDKIRENVPSNIKSFLEGLPMSDQNKIVDKADFPIMVGGGGAGGNQIVPVKPMAQRLNKAIIGKLCERIGDNPTATDSIVDTTFETISKFVRADATKRVKDSIEPITELTKERFSELRDKKEKIKKTTKENYQNLIEKLVPLMTGDEQRNAIKDIVVDLEILLIKLCTDTNELNQINSQAIEVLRAPEEKLNNAYKVAMKELNAQQKGGKPRKTKRRKIVFKKTRRSHKK